MTKSKPPDSNSFHPLDETLGWFRKPCEAQDIRVGNVNDLGHGNSPGRIREELIALRDRRIINHEKNVEFGGMKMAGSQIWTREEAIADLARLLEAAEDAPQYISSNSGRFMVTFQKRSGEQSAALFSTPGPLEEDDISDL